MPRRVPAAAVGLVLALTALPGAARVEALPGAADLAVTLTDPASVQSGVPFTYTATVTNNGPSDALAVTLTDVVQDRPHQAVGSLQVSLGATIDSATYTVSTNPPVDCPFDNTKRVAVCMIGNLAAGATATATITVVPQLDTEWFNPGDPGYRPAETQRDIANRATVGSATPDDDPTDNVAVETTHVTA